MASLKTRFDLIFIEAFNQRSARLGCEWKDPQLIPIWENSSVKRVKFSNKWEHVNRFID